MFNQCCCCYSKPILDVADNKFAESAAVLMLKSRRAFTGSAAMSAHTAATTMHFPVDAGLIFLTDKLTNDRFLVDTGATLSIIPCSSNSNPSGPLLKRVK
jgi:hypothetical protein